MDSEKTNAGGGSGGGTGMDDGNNMQSATGTYQIGGNRVVLIARPNTSNLENQPSSITLIAGGALPTFADAGRVDVRGARAVRISSGPPPALLGPDVTSANTDGIEVIASGSQSITLVREDLLVPTGSQTIRIVEGNITIDAGLTGKITLQAGTNSITIDAAAGITIVGLPFVQINPAGPPPPPPAPFIDAPPAPIIA